VTTRAAAATALAALALLPTLTTTPPPASITPASATRAAAAPRAARPAAFPADPPPPAPPPVDPELLPDDPDPSPAPGVRQRYTCTRATTDPVTTRAGAAPLLWGARLLRLPELWRDAGGTGTGLRLAVIDTGVSPHRLLAGRLRGGGDFVGGGDGTQDCDGHGTAVAGIAASATDPATGFSGVAPGAQVLAIRQTSANLTVRGPDGQESGTGDTTSLARAVLHAVREHADVINISLTSCRPPPRQATALQAALDYAMRHDVVVVASAGNTSAGPRDGGGPDPRPGGCPSVPDAGTVSLPGWYDADVLTVGAVGPTGVPAPFSYPGGWVDVAAPGERLLTLSPGGDRLTGTVDRLDDAGTDTPGPVDGTSFAAPAVAGLALLVRQRYPALTARQVMDRIEATARGAAGARDPRLGYGVIDPVAALTRLPEVLPPPSAGPPVPGGRLSVTRPDPGAAAGGGAAAALWGGALAVLAALVAVLTAVGRARAPRAADPCERRSVL
jgi:membrane-anchored mycosin MYCP